MLSKEAHCMVSYKSLVIDRPDDPGLFRAFIRHPSGTINLIYIQLIFLPFFGLIFFWGGGLSEPEICVGGWYPVSAVLYLPGL